MSCVGDDIEAVCDAITDGDFDRAEEIVETLRRMGWLSPSDVERL